MAFPQFRDPWRNRRPLGLALAVTLAAAACSQATEGTTSTSTAPTTSSTEAATTASDAVRYRDPSFTQVRTTLGVPFAEVSGAELDGSESAEKRILLADIYEPAGDEATDRPLIVMFFGGGFVGGERDDLGMQALASYLTRHGYVVASVDYRVLGRAPVDQGELARAARRAVEDGVLAVSWFRNGADGTNTYGIDPDAIVVAGVSAGGIIAATLATSDEPGFPDVAGALVISGAVADLSSIDADDAPLFLAHEELDPVVPCGVGAEGSSDTGLQVAGGCALLERAQEVGLPAAAYLVAGQATHVGFSAEQFETLGDEATDFLWDTVVSTR